MKKYHFENNESYTHIHAKRVLADWLAFDYLKITEEEPFKICGILWFVPDLTGYTDQGIKDLYEVVNTHDVDIFKQWRMYKYFQLHGWEDVNVFTIDANWIMRQTRKPEPINFTKII